MKNTKNIKRILLFIATVLCIIAVLFASSKNLHIGVYDAH